MAHSAHEWAYPPRSPGGVRSVNGTPVLDPDPDLEHQQQTPALGSSGGVLGQEAPAGVPLAVGPTAPQHCQPRGGQA
jgi:hypothetical protein